MHFTSVFLIFVMLERDFTLKCTLMYQNFELVHLLEALHENLHHVWEHRVREVWICIRSSPEAEVETDEAASSGLTWRSAGDGSYHSFNRAFKREGGNLLSKTGLPKKSLMFGNRIILVFCSNALWGSLLTVFKGNW